jgi:excisionase family DNA binding protein
VFSDALASAKVPVLDLAARYAELGQALLPLINPAVTSKYGIEISSFIVENISVPPEVEQAIDQRSSMAAIGNLNDFVKFQMAESMTKGGGEAGGMAGTAAGLGAGLAMGQQMMAAMNTAQTTPPVATSGAGATPELLGPADVAKVLGVSEADVLASLEKGDLKGKKIGSTWRVTKAALDEFLKS